MSAVRSITSFVSTLFNESSKIVGTVGSAASVVTEYVDNRATAHSIADRQVVIDGLTETLKPIRDKLDSDEEYKTLFTELEKEFETRSNA